MRARVLLPLAACVALFGCAKSDRAADADDTESAVGMTSHDEAASDDAKYKHGVTADAMEKADPTGIYGGGITMTETVPIGDIMADPAAFAGKTVVVSGTVTEVCPMAGCWIDVTSGEQTIRVKVVDGEIVFPLSARDHTATVEGVVEGIDLTLEEARNWMAHEAEEMGREFDPATVTEPMTIWRIKGRGAEISG